MIHYALSHKDIIYKNIVAYISNSQDIEQLGFLDLDTVIIEDIRESLRKKESSAKNYFLGKDICTELFVCIGKEESYEKSVNFLGQHFPKFPDELCLITTGGDNKKLLLEVCELSRYKFQDYKTEKKERKTQILCDVSEKKELKDLEKTLENICVARDLGEMPSSDLTPEKFVHIVKKTNFKNTKIKILSDTDIKEKGLGLIHAVGKGSENAPRMIILEHIVDKKKPILGIVGKGVTFDTGGNQIKPGDYMYDMKGDMGGAAVTYALMRELDRHNVDKNIVACLCLAENSVSGAAYKPSDILRGYTGKTVEVIHTDAEGRLVMADGMSYIGKKYKTSQMMTIATLTGACMVALGYRYAGVMGTDKDMIQKLRSYSESHTEKYVELPFDDHLKEKTKSEIADFKNLDRSVHAGASMGAAFLSNFLENNEMYTHIDIAGAYINEGEAYGKMPKGMTGFGVESLSHILRS